MLVATKASGAKAAKARDPDFMVPIRPPSCHWVVEVDDGVVDDRDVPGIILYGKRRKACFYCRFFLGNMRGWKKTEKRSEKMESGLGSAEKQDGVTYPRAWSDIV